MKVIDGMKMYSSQEVCALLGVQNVTLIKYRKKGLIKSVAIGRGKFTSEEALREFLNGKTQPQREQNNEKETKKE